jgi:hypothetical protein
MNIKQSYDNEYLIINSLYVDWGSRFVGDVNWGSVVGTGLSGPTLSIL